MPSLGPPGLVALGDLQSGRKFFDVVQVDEHVTRLNFLNSLQGTIAELSQVFLPEIFAESDRKSTRLNSSHYSRSRMPSSA